MNNLLETAESTVKTFTHAVDDALHSLDIPARAPVKALRRNRSAVLTALLVGVAVWMFLQRRRAQHAAN